MRTAAQSEPTTTDRHTAPGTTGTRERRPSSPGSTGGSGLFIMLWLLFLVVLAVEPTRLDAVWAWFRDLPVVAQVVGWVLLLPIVVGLAIWQAPWALEVRVTLILALAFANIIVFSPKATNPRSG